MRKGERSHTGSWCHQQAEKKKREGKGKHGASQKIKQYHDAIPNYARDKSLQREGGRKKKNGKATKERGQKEKTVMSVQKDNFVNLELPKLTW